MRLSISTLVLALLCARTARAACTMDTDCKGDRVCVSGACQNPDQTETSTKESVPASPPAERRSTEIFGTGIGFTITGGLALTAGTVFLVLGIGGHDDGGLIMGGAIAAGSGALLLPAGIVMTVVGGERQVPGKDSEKEQRAAVTVAPWAVPTGGGAAFVGTF